jgi:hypothetical protein
MNKRRSVLLAALLAALGAGMGSGNRDINNLGSVKAVLYSKRKSTGTYAPVATVNSTDASGIKENSVAFATVLDFTTFAYFVSVQLYREASTTNPEFHGVSLKDSP